jgi:DNA-directed RNA polymerase specialized sigma24 family protein
METAAELARKTQERDRAVFDVLYDSLFPKVYNFVATRIGDRPRAEAIVKEIFFDLIASLDRIPAEESVLHLAFRLTKRRLTLEDQVSGDARNAG